MSGQAAEKLEQAWPRLRPTTLVDRVIDAVIAAAARGDILPGDRIVETEVAERLGDSRVPVREALRLLESQDVVVNTPYRGIRLTVGTPERVGHLALVKPALAPQPLEPRAEEKLVPEDHLDRKCQEIHKSTSTKLTQQHFSRRLLP